MKKSKDCVINKIKKLVWELLDFEMTCEEISELLEIDIGTRYVKGTINWYKFCKVAKENQKKAFQKYGVELYSKAGKIAQKKHPWIGHKLGSKYGSEIGKKRMKYLRANGEIHNYFSNAAKKLHEKFPEHSKKNIRKAHETMKKNGNFNLHQKEAALACIRKHPLQLKKMSKIAHSKYDLAKLARISKRKKHSFEFMNCYFDSFQEMKVCEILVRERLIEKPIEGANIHFKIKNYEIDFFIKNKIFLEFHPPITWGERNETKESYFNQRKKIIKNSQKSNCKLFVISNLKETTKIIQKIKYYLDKYNYSPSNCTKLTNL